jgi:hypothetical protein
MKPLCTLLAAVLLLMSLTGLAAGAEQNVNPQAAALVEFQIGCKSICSFALNLQTNSNRCRPRPARRTSRHDKSRSPPRCAMSGRTRDTEIWCPL